MSKNKMNKALAANRVVALFSHKDKNGTPRYDIYKMKQESNPPTTTPQCTHLSMYFEGVQKQSSEPATKQMMQENQRNQLHFIKHGPVCERYGKPDAFSKRL